jgi:hypothetical protein
VGRSRRSVGTWIRVAFRSRSSLRCGSLARLAGAAGWCREPGLAGSGVWAGVERGLDLKIRSAEVRARRGVEPRWRDNAEPFSLEQEPEANEPRDLDSRKGGADRLSGDELPIASGPGPDADASA